MDLSEYGGEERDSAKSCGRPEGLPKRWSARRKSEVVLRLLRGEDIGEVSREVRIALPEPERWRREFPEGGQQDLKVKNRPGGELMRTRAKLGEMTMWVELQAEILEWRRTWPPRRPRRAGRTGPPPRDPRP